MADPHAAAAIPAAQTVAASGTVAAAIGTIAGLPLDLVGYALFGGLIAEAYGPPRARDGGRLAVVAAMALYIGLAAGLGGAMAETGADVAVALAGKLGIALNDDAILQRACAIVIGFCTQFLGVAGAAARRRINKDAAQ